KLVQLMGTSSRQPIELVVAKDTRTLADMMNSRRKRDIAAYANGVGPDKSSIMGLDANGKLTDPTDLVRNAHNAGLVVHPYTFRPENTFLPPS
ncbi:hypothetical protein NY815_10390, partial [Escherichia coli]|nr:hypothetical protein [Escherichia coli]